MSGAVCARTTIVAAIALAATFGLQSARGQSPDAPQTVPLVYRRVYVPEEALESQIRGLLPLARDEFERRIALARAAVDRSSGLAQIRMEEAVFRARLDGNVLRDGAAEIIVSSVAKQPSLLALAPCNVAIESAVWQTQERRAAVIGADPRGELQCLVEASGTLRLTWSQAAVTSAAEETTFDLRLPSATRRRLEIVAPTNIELAVDAGLIVASGPADNDPEQRVWSIELGGQSQIRLTARAAKAEREARALVVVCETTSYSVLRSTLDMETSFKFSVPAQPLKELRLEADEGLEITAVRMGEQSLPFRAASGAGEGLRAVSVPLFETITGTDQTIEISATTEWPADGRWRLPRIKVAGGLLQEGQVEVNAPAWLRLSARPVKGCVQTAATPAAAGRASDRFEFQMFDPDAAIEIAADESTALLYEESATRITVESNQVLGVLAAELTSLGTGQYVVVAQVPRNWIVDTVETQPPELLADRSLTAKSSGPQILQLTLTRPLTTQRPLSLIIRAHYRRPANNRPLGDEFFQVASFPESQGGRRLVAVRVNDPGAELRLAGDQHLKRIDPARLTQSDSRLLEAQPGPLLFERGFGSDGLTATLAPASARYQTEVLVRAEVEPRGSLWQSISIRCQPEASAVGSVVVRLAPRPRGEVSWRLAGDDTREVAVVVEGQGAGTTTADGVVYRLVLPRPQTTAFEIVGRWSAAISSSSEVSLASLPEATRQTGIVEVHAPDGEALLRTSEVQPLPRPQRADKLFTTLRGRFQYEAGRRNQVVIDPARRSEVLPVAWVESLELTSHFSTDGNGEHEAAFWVVNAGERSFQLRLPASVNDCHLVQDDGLALPLDSSANGSSFVVPLPAGQQRALVRVRYSASQRALGIWPAAKLTAPIPQPDLTVLGQRWHILLAPGLAAMTSGHRKGLRPSAALPTDSDGASQALKNQLQSLGGALAGPALATHLPFWGPESWRSSEKDFAGWSAFELALPRKTEATVTVYRTSVFSAWSMGLGLIAAAIAFWLALPMRWVVLESGLLLAAAAASDAPLAWLLFAASMGTIVGSLLQVFRAWPREATSSLQMRAERTTALLPTGAASSSVTMAVLGLASCLFAAPQANRGGENGVTPRVVFPIGEQQQPAGDYVYLDKDLYDRLHSGSNAGRATQPAWLLERARYELPSAGARHGESAGAGELMAAFDLHTFTAGATIELPLRRDQVLLLEGRARLDGQPAKLSWQADGQALLAQIETVGKHRLELALGVTAGQTAAGAGHELSVPPAAMTTFSLAVGNAVVNQSPPGAVATTPGGTLDFRLPVSNKLGLALPVAAAATTTAATHEAEQLLWWKIRPGSVILEGRFRLRPLGGSIREATINIDPRLRLLPGLTVGPISRVRTAEGSSSQLKIELAEPVTTEVELRLAWLWPEASGVGQLLLPRARLVAERMVRDWTALTLEPGLEIERLPAADYPSIADFRAAWNAANEIPSAILTPAADDQGSNLVVRPVVSLPQATVAVDWSISNSLAQAIITAGLSKVPTTQYEHRLALPLQLKLVRVELTQAGRVVATRWKQERDGLLIVSLLESPLADQTLTIAAHLPLAKGRPQVRLPAVGLVTVKQTHCELHIYRQADVQLEVQSGSGWSRQELADGEQRREMGRLVASLRSNSERAAPPSVSRLANKPQVKGQIIIRAEQADGDWQGEVNLNLEASGGVLDEIRLAVPEEWSENLTIEPAMELRVDASLGEPRRQLILRPREAISGKFTVRIRGTLQSGGSGLQAPDVSLVGNPEIERFVLLDNGSAGEHIDWEMTGLLAAGARGAALLPAPWRDTGGDLFRVVAARFDATARTRQASSSQPRIRLADVQATVLPGRRVLVTSAMTIQPMGAGDFTFSLPPGRRLVQALVDGVAAQCAPSGVRSWKLAAPSDVLPFRLTIVYDTYVPASDAHPRPLVLTAPQLAGVEVQRLLWTVDLGDRELDAAFIPGAAIAAAGSSARECSAAEAALVRLQALAQSLDDIASAQGTSVPASVLTECFVRWQGELQASHRRFVQLAEQEPVTEEFREQARAALDAASKVRQRLIQAGVIDEDTFAAAGGGEFIERDTVSSALHFEVVGRGTELEIVWPSDEGRWPISRPAIALGIGALTLLLWIAAHFSAARDWLAGHGHLALALAGTVWWLVAPLGWLGWLLVLTAAWLAILPPKRRAAYDTGSTLRRFSNSQLR